MPVLKSSNEIIHVMVVIDTESLVRDYSSGGRKPSQSKDDPSQIGHQYSYMVAAAGSVVSGAGGGDLTIKANVGDLIRWTGQSASANFDDSVLIYGLPQFGGTEVFSNPAFKMFTKSSMEPAKNTIFPVSFPNQTYWFTEADISNTGTEQYQVRFAVYNRPTGGAQSLFGYFQWDPTITVQN